MFKVTYTNTHTCNFNRPISPLSTPQPSPFTGSIEHDSGIDQMLHLQECKPSMPKLLTQGSCTSDAILSATYTSGSVIETNCEWDIDSLLRDLIGFAPDNFPLI